MTDVGMDQSCSQVDLSVFDRGLRGKLQHLANESAQKAFMARRSSGHFGCRQMCKKIRRKVEKYQST